MDSVKSGIEYHSNERREALRVSPVGHTICFDGGTFKFACIDISVDGTSLASDDSFETIEDEVVGFVVDQDGIVVGKVKARLIYRQAERSGWQFTAMEDSVREYVETLVLNTQKESLRAAAVERMKEEEKDLLDLDEEE
ncbi:PilZ domain-containing protein [Marinomonas ostreistagni]|uniref:PilZ domain-containing protein n=1 Tax=Marinomonas ostreistagni TaxID=359209 RepID=UPI00194DED99|nr:PilZ domain-containing protein [Marinomonas ostreistagni]MBM6550126.1 PilZ domain-containing protein [Marinomonas ostreistagni]